MELNHAFDGLGLKERKEEAQLLVRGFTSINIALDKRSKRLDEEQEEQLNVFWKKYQAGHPEDVNGSVLSLKQYCIKKKELCLTVRPSNFASHLATQPRRPSRLAFTGGSMDNNYPLALSVGAVTTTTDDCMVFCKRTKTAFNSEEYTLPPGGYLNLDDKFCQNDIQYISAVKGIRREYLEELSGLGDCFNISLLGLVYSCIGSRQPLIAVELKIPYSKKEVEAMLNSTKQDWEMGKFHFVPTSMAKLREFAQNHYLCTHDVWKLALWVSKNL